MDIRKKQISLFPLLGVCILPFVSYAGTTREDAEAVSQYPIFAINAAAAAAEPIVDLILDDSGSMMMAWTQGDYRDSVRNLLWYNTKQVYKPWPFYDSSSFEVTRLPSMKGPISDTTLLPKVNGKCLIDPFGRPKPGQLTATQYNCENTWGNFYGNGNVFRDIDHILYQLFDPITGKKKDITLADKIPDVVDPVTGTTISGKENFANWLHYYSYRYTSAVGSLLEAFSDDSLLGKMRVGYRMMNFGRVDLETTGVFGSNKIGTLKPVFFDKTGRKKLMDSLVATRNVNSGTPMRSSLLYSIYEMQNSPTAWLNDMADPSSPKSACRQSVEIVITDGEYNENNDMLNLALSRTGYPSSGLTSSVNGLPPPFSPNQQAAITNVTTTSPSDLLSFTQIATYFYKNDFMPSIDNKVPALQSETYMFNGQKPNWQRLRQYYISFGLTKRFASSISVDFDDVAQKAAAGIAIPWGNDDYWKENYANDMVHAALNSNGKYFSVNSSSEFANALKNILNDVSNFPSDRPITSFGSTSRLETGTKNLAYKTSFSNKDNVWNGNIKAFEVNESGFQLDGSGKIVESGSEKYLWDASEKLVSAANAGSRAIFTTNPDNNKKVAGAATILSSALDAWFSSFGSPLNTTHLPKLKEFLYGKGGDEVGSGLGLFRSRTQNNVRNVLGDYISYDPISDYGQNFGWSDFSGGQNYNQFLTTSPTKDKKTEPLLMVGSNDGMVHIFNGSANGGNEILAYIPKSQRKTLPQFVKSDYKHQYFVDGKLSVQDYMDGTSWQRLLTGTTGRGEPGVFALNITNIRGSTSGKGISPSQLVVFDLERGDVKSEEARAAALAGGSFDVDLGYITGGMAIAPFPDGKWYAVFGNGYYTSQNGKERRPALYFYDLAAGKVSKILTLDKNPESQLATRANGLGDPFLMMNSTLTMVTGIYAGDYQGNLWYFDVSTSSKWNTLLSSQAIKYDFPNLLFKARRTIDPKTNEIRTQSLANKPVLSRHPDSGVLISLVSGRRLGKFDDANFDDYKAGNFDPGLSFENSLYTIWHNPDKNIPDSQVITVDRLVERKIKRRIDLPSGAQAYAVDKTNLDRYPFSSKSKKYGWYYDFSVDNTFVGEKATGSPTALLGYLTLSTSEPASTILECEAAVPKGRTYLLDVYTGLAPNIGTSSQPVKDALGAVEGEKLSQIGPVVYTPMEKNREAKNSVTVREASLIQLGHVNITELPGIDPLSGDSGDPADRRMMEMKDNEGGCLPHDKRIAIINHAGNITDGFMCLTVGTGLNFRF